MDAVLEGLHALKHAVRFGAVIAQIVTDDLERALATADQVAPELKPLLETQARLVAPTRFRELAAQPVPTHVLAYAERPAWTLGQAVPTAGHPAVLLDDPRNSKNLGAVIRVGAAAGASGVLVRGTADPFDRMAVRGAAGLQWALPCLGGPDMLADVDAAWTGTAVIGLDADGVPFDPSACRTPTVFVFGSERTGLSDEVRARCDAIVSLPMQPEVSSLNLATAVSAVLYVGLYAQPVPPTSASVDDETSPALADDDKAWKAEFRRRVDDIESGRLQMVSHAETMRLARERIAQRRAESLA